LDEDRRAVGAAQIHAVQHQERYPIETSNVGRITDVPSIKSEEGIRIADMHQTHS
jgi:hypothetical protein